MTAMAEITRRTIVYSTLHSGADQRKHPGTASHFGINLWTTNFQTISAICLHIIKSCRISKLEIMLGFTYIPLAPMLLVMFWGIVYRNKVPQYLMDRTKKQSIYTASHQIKCYLIDLCNYKCSKIKHCVCSNICEWHDDVMKWKHFPRYWPFVRAIHRSPVNYPHKGQWRGALMFSLICVWINAWVNNRKAGDLRRHRAHYDVIVMTNHLGGDFSTVTSP